MADYLQPVSRALRITIIVGCTLTSVICLLLSVMLWTDMIRRHSFDNEGKPLWMGAAVVGVIGLASAFIAWRLVRRQAAANGVTVMPVWFIQVFGVLLLSGLCFVAYHRDSVVFMFEGVSICLAMIFVGRHIAKRQRETINIRMVTILPSNATTEREWNFRDDIDQNYFGNIPESQPIITLTLNWKPDATSQPRIVGRYRIDLTLLVSEGLAQKTDRGVQLRFQRTGEVIEIAVDRQSPLALAVGRKPQE